MGLDSCGGRKTCLCAGLVPAFVVPTIGQGVFFSHGQEGDQFPKVDREFSLLGLWRGRFAGADLLSSFRLADSMIMSGECKTALMRWSAASIIPEVA